MNDHALHIRKAILLPLALALLLLLALSVSGAYWLQRYQFDQNLRLQLNSVQQLFHATLGSEAEHLSTFIELIASDPQLQQAFAARDRGLLYHSTLPVFQRLANRHQVTHFYFHDPDGTCFLRVHKRGSHGDLISRYTLQKATNEGIAAVGLELGPFGTLTLRVVQPWRVAGRLLGFIELGREIEYIIPVMKEILGYDFLLLVDISHLDRSKWEEGARIRGRQGKWEEIPGHVVIGRTMAAIPPEINRCLGLPPAERKDLIFDLKQGGKRYRGGFTPLTVVSGAEIGEIVALRDCTNEVARQQVSAILIIVCMAVLGLLFVLFYFYTGRMERRLVRIHDDLTAEIETRKRVEEDLQQHKASLEETVTQRTAELSGMNRQLQIEIAERKGAELSLQAAHGQLEERIRERTETLEKTYNQLLHAEKLSAIGKLSASIAHEFNNPIYGIRNVLAGLQRKEALPDARQREMVDLAVRECDRIAKLTRDLQSFNRPTSGLMATVDLHEAITDMLLLIKKELKQKNIRVEKQFAPNLPAIQAIPDQIRQVLLNMLNNASDSIPAEGGTITLATENLGDEITIRITDSGSGIRPEDLENIFEPFFSTKPAVKGTGLGLSVSYGIIKRHGGSIEVQSSPGQGSTFTIRLPVSQIL